LTVPAIDPSFKDDYDASGFVNSMVANVRCQLRKAVKETYQDLKVTWLPDWSAQISLTLTIDEKLTLSPGLSATRYLPTKTQSFANGSSVSLGRSLGLGAGGLVSNDANREQVITWFLTFQDLLAEKDNGKPCELVSPYKIRGDLKIKEALYSGVFPASVKGAMSQPFVTGGPLQVIQHHVWFQTVMSGTVTPTFTLTHISGNANNTFFEGQRTRKDDLLITMGPTQLTDISGRKLGKPQPSIAVENQHLASQIGQAVRSALQNP